MPIRFHCESCEARVKVPGGSEGRKVKCPRCGHLQRVPHHADQRVAIGQNGDPDDSSHGTLDGGDSGSFEAQPQLSASDFAEERTSTRNAPRKGGVELGDSLADLARKLEGSRDMTPPDVTARALEKHERTESADKSAAPAPRPLATPPRPAPLTTWTSRKVEQKPVSSLLPRQVNAYPALRNLATALRVIPALMIPATLWHVLNAPTLSASIVTIITGGSIVAITWTLAEIADAVRDMAIGRDELTA